MTTINQPSQLEAILSTMAAQTEAINALTKALILNGATAPKPAQLARTVPAAIQPNLLAQAKGIDDWLPIIEKWIQRLPEGRSFTHYQLCRWVEEESGIILSDADRRHHPGNKTVIWKLCISRALRKMKEDGTLSKKAGTGEAFRSCTYMVAYR